MLKRRNLNTDFRLNFFVVKILEGFYERERAQSAVTDCAGKFSSNLFSLGLYCSLLVELAFVADFFVEEQVYCSS